MTFERDLSGFWCWHKDCPDYSKKCFGNIVNKEFYGKNDTAILKCRTCGHCFSETRGTPFFGLTTSWNEVVREPGLRFPKKEAFAESQDLTVMIKALYVITAKF